MITTGREQYSWLVRVGSRARVAHAFIPGDPHSVCLFAVRHPMSSSSWQSPSPERGRCAHCRREVERHPHMTEVTSQ